MTHFPKINHIHNSSLRLQYVCVLIYAIVSVVSCSNRDLRKSCILCFLLGSHTRMWNQFLHEQCFLYDFFFFPRHDLCCPLSRSLVACVVPCPCSVYCVVTAGVLLCKPELFCLCAWIFVYVCVGWYPASLYISCWLAMQTPCLSMAHLIPLLYIKQHILIHI